MNNYSKATLFVLAAFFVVGCSRPKGLTNEEKRDFVLKMRDDTMAQLYAKKPDAKYLIDWAPGYGVFSNVSSHFLFLGTGSGYGVVTNNATGEKTYMNMALADVGLGFGIKDFRAIFVFVNPDIMNKFIYSGWEFGPEADAAFKSGEKGGAGSSGAILNQNIIVYQITEAGITIKASLRGMKFWRSGLNNY